MGQKRGSTAIMTVRPVDVQGSGEATGAVPFGGTRVLEAPSAGDDRAAVLAANVPIGRGEFGPGCNTLFALGRTYDCFDAL